MRGSATASPSIPNLSRMENVNVKVILAVVAIAVIVVGAAIAAPPRPKPWQWKPERVVARLIAASPINGGVGSGVTYIVFTGDSYVDPIEDPATAASVGKALAKTLLTNN